MRHVSTFANWAVQAGVCGWFLALFLGWPTPVGAWLEGRPVWVHGLVAWVWFGSVVANDEVQKRAQAADASAQAKQDDQERGRQ